MARVTIVVATYNRPQLLKHTIASILKQSFEDWILLVVGDQCADETRELMESYSDDRIFYLNLETRCGEQSGPNSAGFFAASTEYVAFANHDDIWLPDHLAHAVATLDQGHADFYGAGAGLTTLDVLRNIPVVWERTPAERQVSQSYFNMPVLFEPVSAWVVRRSLFEVVGAWRPASTIYRTPLEDWVLRLWRKDVPCHFDSKITVLYCNAEKTAWQREGREGSLYGKTESEGEYWNEQIEQVGAERFRQMTEQHLKALEGLRNWTFFKYQYQGTQKTWVFESLLTEATARLCKETGWDGHAEAWKILGGKAGYALDAMLKRRTGEALPAHKDWRNVSTDARKRLESDARWQRMNGHA